MIGIIDVGGGMRGIYTSGLFDYLMDKGISFKYYLGVSSGSANLIAYAAGQRGRTYRFYTEDAFDKKFMGIGAYFRTGMIMNLDKIFENPLSGDNVPDFNEFVNADFRFTAVSTHMKSLEPAYFTKEDLKHNNFSALKAAAAMPVACRRPVKFNGELYFDGGLSDPIPYQKAFDDGCDKVIVCITKPEHERKDILPWYIVKPLLIKYPHVADSVLDLHTKYNEGVDGALRLREEGKVLVVAPEECFGINTITRELDGLNKLYQLGYKDGRKIEEFLIANEQYI
ncbi:MAG: patatin family protein [Clostridia bacterium]|nr:patatin family protein [Clostridia bacterium]